MHATSWAVVVAVVLATGFSAQASAQTFTFDGTFAGTAGRPKASAISPDGKVVLGYYSLPNAVYQGFRWDGITMADLGHLGGNRTFPTASSFDGSVVVGTSNDALGEGHPFRWSQGAIVDLGTLGGAWGNASDVSADGKVVVGDSETALGEARAFRWSDGIMVNLGTLPGDIRSTARSISADGTVITGQSYMPSGVIRSYLWNNGTFVDLGSLAGDNTTSLGISADGKTIVGTSAVNGQNHAFRWSDGSMIDLGTNGMLWSVARAVSANGSLIVGYFGDGNGNRAFRWTPAKGILSLEDLLTAAGANVSGWKLQEANGISDDGTVIVGQGTNPSGQDISWIVRCTDNCGILDPASAATSFAGLGAMGVTGAAYLGGELGAMGAMASAAKASGTPATGFAYGAFDSDPTTSATIGVTYDVGDDLIIGGSLGAAGILTNLAFGGSSTFSGPSASVFAASTRDAGFNWLVGGSLMGVSGTVTRGYLNGNTPVTSTGSTTGGGAALTAEAGFTFADLLTDTLVTPFVNVTVSSVSYAGYTETGGPFPASFSAFTTSSAMVRIGAKASYEFGDDAYLTAGLAYGHNFANGGGIAGRVPGIIGLSVPAVTAPSDVLEASLGLDVPIDDAIRFSGRLALTVPFTGTPSVQARAGVTMAF